MKSKAVQFLEANQSGERSTFVDDAKWRDSFRQGKLLVQDNL